MGNTDLLLREEASSLSGWTDLIHERFVQLRIAPKGSSDLRGSIATRRLGHLQASVVTSAPQTFTRTPSLASGSTADVFALGLVERGTGYLLQDGRECSVANGAFALYDTSRPFTWAFTDDFVMRVYTWPIASLWLRSAESQRVTAISVPCVGGLGRLIAPMFNQVADDTTEISPAGSVRVAGELAELAMTAALEAQSVDQSTGTDLEVLHSIQAFVEERLSDPSLNADQIAQAFFMSTRSLHRLFARHGLTVNAWMKSRRLEGCRRTLGSSVQNDLPIRDVAVRFGFTNASFFSREFTLQFGESPRQYRARRHLGLRPE
ncbi:helix-turn-helix domain-containing protein [Nocardioides sp. GCM10030258]|uniref:helix-turn-helix domain-containing protein n=1 Tax=unclassified Nocardioides TaxID=2615069 RepID=UPI003615611E